MWMCLWSKLLSKSTTDMSGLLRGLSVPLLPSLQELYTSRVRNRAKKVTLDPSHPAHALFELLPSGWRYRAQSPPPPPPPPGHIPPEQHNTPQYCTSVYNSTNLPRYLAHIHNHNFVWTFFLFLYIFITTVIYNSLYILLNISVLLP